MKYSTENNVILFFLDFNMEMKIYFMGLEIW